nr:MAG TPA: hypothetical protein [Caudoviricetes sp.]
MLNHFRNQSKFFQQIFCFGFNSAHVFSPSICYNIGNCLISMKSCASRTFFVLQV